MSIRGATAKRAMDLALTLAALPLALPLMAAIALWVRLDSPGPALFRQERVGRGGVPFRIHKFRTMHVHDGSGPQVTAAGDARIDNRLFKAQFGRGRMLGADDVVALTGHPVGGVCPFGLAQPLPIYLDHSLRDFDEILPAAGAIHSAVRLSPQQLAEITGGEWVNVCQAANADTA